MDSEPLLQLQEPVSQSLEVILPESWGYKTLTNLLVAAFENPHKVTTKPPGRNGEQHNNTLFHISERHWLRIVDVFSAGEAPDICALAFGYRGSQRIYVEIELPVPWRENHPRQESLKLVVRNLDTPGLQVSSHSLDQLNVASQLISGVLRDFEQA